MLGRRRLSLGLAVACGPAWARPPLAPFVLTIRRLSSLPTVLNLSDCISGVLYTQAPGPMTVGPGFCETLELPFRNELEKASCTAPGTYAGSILTRPTADGRELGWRILLAGTRQTTIELHTGNRPPDTEGCVLLGTNSGLPDSARACTVSSSRAARAGLQYAYGTDTGRPIEVHIL